MPNSGPLRGPQKKKKKKRHKTSSLKEVRGESGDKNHEGRYAQNLSGWKRVKSRAAEGEADDLDAVSAPGICISSHLRRSESSNVGIP